MCIRDRGADNININRTHFLVWVHRIVSDTDKQFVGLELSPMLATSTRYFGEKRHKNETLLKEIFWEEVMFELHLKG